MYINDDFYNKRDSTFVFLCLVVIVYLFQDAVKRVKNEYQIVYFRPYRLKKNIYICVSGLRFLCGWLKHPNWFSVWSEYESKGHDIVTAFSFTLKENVTSIHEGVCFHAAGNRCCFGFARVVHLGLLGHFSIRCLYILFVLLFKFAMWVVLNCTICR